MNLAAGDAGGEELVLQLLYQLMLILVVTRIVVWLVRKLGQTDVSGEILAGLILGPSLLGALIPGLTEGLFTDETAPILNGLAQLGLVLLMFQIGLEFEFRDVIRNGKKTMFTVSAVGIAAPFTADFFTAPFFHRMLPEDNVPDLLGFRLFFAVALSITAIPILGRIFVELGLTHSRTAAVVIGAASIEDIIGWLLLGAVSMIVVGGLDAWWIITHLAGLAGYIALLYFVVRPLLNRYLSNVLRRDARLGSTAIPVVLVVLFGSAAISSNLNVFAIIGGFLLGVALHDNREFADQWRLRVSPLVYSLLLPIFFAYTGVRTDIGSLGDAQEFLILLLVLVIAFGTKLGGCYGAARLVGEPHRVASTIAVAMNTRALMGLVALNIGMELGVVPPSMYTKLVLMAVVSTFVATPVIRHLTRSEQRVTATI
ncbi:transporter (CPA2 family) [Tamaricihabitans halophyticus]|uniref:Transporter (CPA2 family) n=1 Tax=Tamaricihabitans halophyticus TaxID=1262583 RepID=A0A4R2RB05_9PSEU|nr:cation:proton antiporter [Tamaricihabitans halophyticus]TCP56891.1 transporter (CPA2 family) [Tamaricihabitans halophyticus]